MVDVESSEIIYAKESNGKITDWLNLKTKLAEELSSELNNPIQIEEEYTNVEVNEGTISQYSKVIELLEKGELEKANDFLVLLKSVQPGFIYFDELQSELITIKKQIQKIEFNIYRSVACNHDSFIIHTEFLKNLRTLLKSYVILFHSFSSSPFR